MLPRKAYKEQRIFLLTQRPLWPTRVNGGLVRQKVSCFLCLVRWGREKGELFASVEANIFSWFWVVLVAVWGWSPISVDVANTDRCTAHVSLHRSQYTL